MTLTVEGARKHGPFDPRWLPMKPATESAKSAAADDESAATAPGSSADRARRDVVDQARRRLWLDEAEVTLRGRGHEVTRTVRSDLAYYHDVERPQEWKQPEHDERGLEERSDRELEALLARLRGARRTHSAEASANGAA